VSKKISEGMLKSSKKGKEHHFYGRTHTEESKDKIRNSEYHKNLKGSKKGKKNYNWKGDNIGYSSIHGYVNNNFVKPIKCKLCHSKEKKLEWSNKDHKYSRKRKDWQYVCRSCHRRFDNGNN